MSATTIWRRVVRLTGRCAKTSHFDVLSPGQLQLLPHPSIPSSLAASLRLCYLGPTFCICTFCLSATCDLSEDCLCTIWVTLPISVPIKLWFHSQKALTASLVVDLRRSIACVYCTGREEGRRSACNSHNRSTYSRSACIVPAYTLGLCAFRGCAKRLEAWNTGNWFLYQIVRRVITCHIKLNSSVCFNN